MTSRDFCYWLQGYFELDTFTSNKPEQPTLTDKQVIAIKNHLAMVFIHEIDPSFGGPDKQQMLSQAHGGTKLDTSVIARC